MGLSTLQWTLVCQILTYGKITVNDNSQLQADAIVKNMMDFTEPDGPVRHYPVTS